MKGVSKMFVFFDNMVTTVARSSNELAKSWRLPNFDYFVAPKI
jgi:hypothetical protein